MARNKQNREISRGIDDFQYSVNYNSDSSNRGCQCDDICRCSRITSFSISEVSIPSLVESIKKQNSLCASPIEDYCIDRILRSMKAYDPSCWDHSVGNSYYGEEVNKVYLINYDKIVCHVNEMLGLKNDKAKIEFVLILEYGYLLDYLKAMDYEVRSIPRNELHLNNEYVKKVDCEGYYSEENYTGIRGVARLDGLRYRLIDGYHRCVVTRSPKIKLIVAYKG